MSQARQNLIAARALIADKTRWTQGRFAAAGPLPDDECGTLDESATCFCALGALYNAARYDTARDNEVATHMLLPGYQELYTAAEGVAPGCPLPDINDGVVSVLGDPHAAILEIYDRAIAATA